MIHGVSVATIVAITTSTPNTSIKPLKLAARCAKDAVGKAEALMEGDAGFTSP
jgi:hypothetical protein